MQTFQDSVFHMPHNITFELIMVKFSSKPHSLHISLRNTYRVIFENQTFVCVYVLDVIYLILIIYYMSTTQQTTNIYCIARAA